MANGTLVRKVFLKITADDGDTELKLDRIAEKADELGAKHPELKVRIDTAAASAKVAVLRQELKSLDEEAAGGGLASKLSGLTGIGATLGGNLGAGGGLFAGGAGVLAMAAPLAAAASAVGAFALVAVPELSKVHAALSKTGKAGQQAFAQLTPAEKQLAGPLRSIGAAFGGVEKAVAPVVDHVAALAAKVGTDLMPALGTLATAGGSVLTSFLTPLDAFVKSPAFGRFIDQFARFAVQAGNLVGPQLVRLIGVFTQLFVQVMPAGMRILSILLPLIIQLTGDLVPVIAVVANVAAVVLTWLQHTHLLIPVLGVLAAVILALDAPIAATAAAVLILIAVGVELGKNWHKIWHEITVLFDGGRHEIAHIVADIRHDFARWIDDVRHDIAHTFDSIRHDIAHWGDNVLHWFETLPGRIVHALGDLGHLLWNAGENIIKGLIGGIESMFGGVGSAIGGIVGEIRNFLPFSPAKKGPLSGAGSPDIAGRKISDMVAHGIRAGAPGVTEAMGYMTSRAAMIGATAHGGHPGAGGTLKLELEWTGGGDQEIVTFLKKHIRIRGGNPAVLGL